VRTVSSAIAEVNQNSTTAGIVAVMAATLAEKLRITEGRTVRLMRAPDRHLPMLGPFTPGEDTADVVLLYSRSREQLVRDAATAIAAVAAGGVLWVCYPKKSAGTPSDLSRESCRDLIAAHGWRPVAQVAIDDVWSAMRFRPA
jgi:hypothetical protein